MFEQMDTQFNKQDRAITELKKLLLQEIQLRKEDHLKIAELENTIVELKGQLNIADAGFNEKLDQLQLSPRYHEEDIKKHFVHHQNEIYAIITKIDCSFKMNTDVPPTAPDIVHTKLSKLDVGYGMSYPTPRFVPDIMITEKTNSPLAIDGPNKSIDVVQPCNASSADLLGCHGYVNWDYYQHEQFRDLKLVRYKKLHNILNRVLYDEDSTSTYASPKEMSKARNKIAALKVSRVNKFERFPSTDAFVDINLASEKNNELRKMFMTSDGKAFYEAAMRYHFFIKDNTLDRIVFENMHRLQWI